MTETMVSSLVVAGAGRPEPNQWNVLMLPENRLWSTLLSVTTKLPASASAQKEEDIHFYGCVKPFSTDINSLSS